VVNVVGHALRTPVTTLAGMADELANRADDPSARLVLADGVRRNARIVEQLLDDLLVASGVGTALPVGNPVDVDLAEVTRRAWGSLGEPRPLSIAGASVCARVAPTVAEGALVKLLDNAAKYGEGDVEVRLLPGAGVVAAEVDSAGGLPAADELALCEEPFYRGEHAVMRAPGLGIGLTVARALAEHAGGALLLRVDGERFIARIELPAA
jgi:signal transduction histidine kinase